MLLESEGCPKTDTSCLAGRSVLGSKYCECNSVFASRSPVVVSQLMLTPLNAIRVRLLDAFDIGPLG